MPPRFKEVLVMKSPMFLGLMLVILALPVTISSAIANKPNRPTPSETQEKQAAVVWERSGGIAGICQRLTLRSSAAYVLEDCRKQTVVSRGDLPEGDRTEFKKLLLKQYGQFQWQSSNQGADMFNDRYTFNGRGAQKPTLAQQEALNQKFAQWAGQLVQRAQVQQGKQGMIEGQVTLSPTCPVQKPGIDCTKPYQSAIAVLDSQNHLIAQIQTDVAGRFQLLLNPGTYTLEPESEQAYPRAASQKVTVVKGQVLPVKITYDSGIR